MAFIESPRFDPCISFNSRGGPGYLTEVVRVDSGHEKTNSRWQYPLHRFDVAYGIKRQSDMYNLIRMFHAARGRRHGFRYKDWYDYQSNHDMTAAVTPTDQGLGDGDGIATAFQLVKIYDFGTEALTRKIAKPVPGTVIVALDAVAQPGGWTVDTATGVITFDTPPGAGVAVSAGFLFDVPVRFDIDQLEVETVNKEDTDQYLADTSVPLQEVRV